MSQNNIPLPYADQYECRGEVMEIYASDRRGTVMYQFNNYGYRNDIDYAEGLPVAVYHGSSITAAIGIDWNKGFAKLSSSHFDVPCYHFAQGCCPVDNREILRMLDQTLQLDAKFFVVQFIGLDRRYDHTTNQLTYCTDQEKNLAEFYQVFDQCEQTLKHRPWCFISSDEANHPVKESIKTHPNCAAWNFTYVDQAGVTNHPGAKWHAIMSHGIVKKLKQLL